MSGILGDLLFFLFPARPAQGQQVCLSMFHVMYSSAHAHFGRCHDLSTLFTVKVTRNRVADVCVQQQGTLGESRPASDPKYSFATFSRKPPSRQPPGLSVATPRVLRLTQLWLLPPPGLRKLRECFPSPCQWRSPARQG